MCILSVYLAFAMALPGSQLLMLAVYDDSSIEPIVINMRTQTGREKCVSQS